MRCTTHSYDSIPATDATGHVGWRKVGEQAPSPAPGEEGEGEVEEIVSLSRSYICSAADTYVLHNGKVLGMSSV